MYKENILKKLSKGELIEIILDMQKQKNAPAEVVDPMAAFDKRMAELAQERAQEPKPVKKEKKYICDNCKKEFVDPFSVFIKDINNPICEKCKKSYGRTR